MKMRLLPKGVEIKPGQTVEFKPGSYHLMFVGLKQPFEKGKRVKGTLQFEKAGTVEVEYAVEAIGGDARQGSRHGQHGSQGRLTVTRRAKPQGRSGRLRCGILWFANNPELTDGSQTSAGSGEATIILP